MQMGSEAALSCILFGPKVRQSVAMYLQNGGEATFRCKYQGDCANGGLRPPFVHNPGWHNIVQLPGLAPKACTIIGQGRSPYNNIVQMGGSATLSCTIIVGTRGTLAQAQYCKIGPPALAILCKQGAPLGWHTKCDW